MLQQFIDIYQLEAELTHILLRNTVIECFCEEKTYYNKNLSSNDINSLNSQMDTVSSKHEIF